MNKAVFLDRDGVINKERGDYTSQMEHFEFVADLDESLRKFRDHNFRLIIISNQSGIAKGLYSFADVEKLHTHIRNCMKEKGIEFDEIYYCPHHPDTGRCLCRKPGSLLVEKALARFNINPSDSFFIGDRERDVEAAEKVFVKGILVPSNSSISGLADQLIHQTFSN